MAEKAEIVTFGKYKGLPVTAMLQDVQYCDWLMQQNWFCDRYKAIHTLIINNFGQPSETPEHNRLQNYILKQNVIEQIVKYFTNKNTKIGDIEAEPEVDGWDIKINWFEYKCEKECEHFEKGCPFRYSHCLPRSVLIEVKPSIGDDYPSIIRQMKANSIRDPYGEKMLIYQQYNGVGVSEYDMIAQFKMCGFDVCRLDEKSLMKWMDELQVN